MQERTALKQVSAETMRFMRNRYALDEMGNGKDELKFRQGKKTILTVYIRDDRFDFLVIFGKAEREQFEREQASFSDWVRGIYDGSKTYHDGKWMTFPVDDMEKLEEIKRLVMIKKKPNRKPFPTDKAVYSRCNMRCDLCVHYTGGTVSDEMRKELFERVTRVYGPGEHFGNGDIDKMMRCGGCHSKDENDECPLIQCINSKELDVCTGCGSYPCEKIILGHPSIEPKSISADDITWAVLPYADYRLE